VKRGKLDISVILILLLTSSPFLVQAQEDTSSFVDYFPANIGDERQYYYPYSQTDTGFSSIEYVSGSIYVNENTYYVFEPSIFAAIDSAYFRKDTIGNIYQYYKKEAGFAKGETIWFRFNVTEGDTYHTKTILRDSTHYYIVTVVSRNDSINTRSGNFTDCIQFFFDQDNPEAIDDEMWIWLTSGVGIVKYKSYWTERWLYYAKIGGIEYPPGPLNNAERVFKPPDQFSLFQPYPNPFNPTTTIEFSIPQSSIVTLTVYDILGRKVETILNDYKDVGQHQMQWNASNIPSGVYFVRMHSGSFSQVRKAMVVR